MFLNVLVLVVDLKALPKEHGLRGYSKLRKAELINFLHNNLQPTPTLQHHPQHPTRSAPWHPPPPALWHPQSGRFRPYQLRHKRGNETFIEPPVEQIEVPSSSNPEQIKCMKKKLSKLNKKIRHSKRKHNNLISKQNSIRKKIEELKGSREHNEAIDLETRINLIENQTRVRTYEMIGSLNHDVSNLILNTIWPVIEMQIRVIYSFSCVVYQGWNQVVQYHKTLSPNGTFTSLNQIEEYIQQCELRHLNLDNEEKQSLPYCFKDN